MRLLDRLRPVHAKACLAATNMFRKHCLVVTDTWHTAQPKGWLRES
ncbi:hypothetical protein LMG23992_04900 [Cupriavidus laharis]|uniref:Uncharacterized protein n=1 Tax=Cupriavidus laharis TaxID=151654 RepID=A0ABN7ZFQ5_9BURK|nr:hypothetical protein LMG23992_04900 [Cupriavidus laharis]